MIFFKSFLTFVLKNKEFVRPYVARNAPSRQSLLTLGLDASPEQALSKASRRAMAGQPGERPYSSSRGGPKNWGGPRQSRLLHGL